MTGLAFGSNFREREESAEDSSRDHGIRLPGIEGHQAVRIPRRTGFKEPVIMLSDRDADAVARNTLAGSLRLSSRFDRTCARDTHNLPIAAKDRAGRRKPSYAGD